MQGGALANLEMSEISVSVKTSNNQYPESEVGISQHMKLSILNLKQELVNAGGELKPGLGPGLRPVPPLVDVNPPH